MHCRRFRKDIEIFVSTRTFVALNLNIYRYIYNIYIGNMYIGNLSKNSSEEVIVELF